MSGCFGTVFVHSKSDTDECLAVAIFLLAAIFFLSFIYFFYYYYYHFYVSLRFFSYKYRDFATQTDAGKPTETTFTMTHKKK